VAAGPAVLTSWWSISVWSISVRWSMAQPLSSPPLSM